MSCKSNAVTELIEISTGNYNVPPVGYGGAERATFGLAKAMSKRFSVKVIDFDRQPNLTTREGVTVLTLRNRLKLRNQSGLFGSSLNGVTSAFFLFIHSLRLGLFRRKDLLHFHSGVQFSVYFTLMRCFVRNRQQAFCYTLHSPRWMKPSEIPFFLRIFAVPTELLSLQKANLVTFESNAVATSLSKIRPLPARYVILPNGVDTDFFSKENYLADVDHFGILYAANFKRQKDQLTVLKAMARVLREEPRATLLMIGDPVDPSYYREVKKEVNALKLDAAVSILPAMSISKLNIERAKRPIHLVYSSYTGFDVAVGETMSFSVACVFSDIPTLSGVAVDGENCVLVPPGNEVILSQRLLELLRNPRFATRLARQARTDAVTLLGWSNLSGKFLEGVESLLKQQPPV